MLRCVFLILSLSYFAVPLSAETLRSGIDTRGFDRSVRAEDDLFLYVNGEWLKHTPIPDDKSDYGSFTILMDETLLKIRDLVEEAAEGTHAPGSDEQKVGDFFRSFMDQERIDQRGLTPLKEELAKIDNLKSVTEVVRYLGDLQHLGVRTPIGFYVDQDDKNSSQYLAAVVQSGTTLPDRDYYLEDDPKYLQARDALQAYIASLFELAGFENGQQAARAILQLETQLAQVQWERTELRNAEKRYNKYSQEALFEAMPQIAWQQFFEAAAGTMPAEINVVTPSFFEGLQDILQQTSLEVWKQYLRFQLVDAYAPLLPEAFVDAHFQLHAKELAGVPQQKPRWKRAIEATSGAERATSASWEMSSGGCLCSGIFNLDAKERMDQLVQNLLEAYEISIGELSWMTPATREKALEKLSKFTAKIGYPEKWRDYSKLEIRADDLLGNCLRSAHLEHQRMFDKLGKPVDRQEWAMTPQTVNAYYNPGLNEIVFPAAILQPPFFDPEADDAVNYGGIGAVIGHEISHGFDDQGSKYDGDGNLENWWTDRDRQAFTQLTQRLISQYGDYQPLPGKPVNGELTLGENIADLSGLADRAQSLPTRPGGSAFTGPRWVDRRSAVLSRLVADLAPQVPGRGNDASTVDRSAFALLVSRQWTGHEPGRVLRRLRRAAR